MDAVLATVQGLGIRLFVEYMFHDNLKLATSLVGIWEAAVLHQLATPDTSFHHYFAYVFRVALDLRFTQNFPRMVLVFLWTCLGVILLDLIGIPVYTSQSKSMRSSTKRTTSSRIRFNSINKPRSLEPFSDSLLLGRNAETASAPRAPVTTRSPSFPPPPSVIQNSTIIDSYLQPQHTPKLQKSPNGSSLTRIGYNLSDVPIKANLLSNTRVERSAGPVLLKIDSTRPLLEPARTMISTAFNNSVLPDLHSGSPALLDRSPVRLVPDQQPILPVFLDPHPETSALPDPLHIQHHESSPAGTCDNVCGHTPDMIPLLNLPPTTTQTLNHHAPDVTPAVDGVSTPRAGSPCFLEPEIENTIPHALPFPLEQPFQNNHESQPGAQYISEPTFLNPMVRHKASFGASTVTLNVDGQEADGLISPVSGSSVLLLPDLSDPIFSHTPGRHVADIDSVYGSEKTFGDGESVITTGSKGYVMSRAEDFRDQAVVEENERDKLKQKVNGLLRRGKVKEAILLEEEVEEADERCRKLHEKAAHRYFHGALLFCALSTWSLSLLSSS
jgi:hypothetical protein